MKSARPIAFTVESVASYKPKAKVYELRDAVVPGLRLVIQTSGVKTWVLRYSFHGRYQKFTLGRYPEIPLTESAEDRKARIAKNPASDAPDARGLARAALARKLTGINPAAEKKEKARKISSGEADADLVKTVWKSYVEKHLTSNPEVKESSADKFKSIFETHILPKWQDRKIQDIKKRDAIDALDDAKKRGPHAANSTFGVLRSFFNWTVERDILSESPMKGMKIPFDEKQFVRKRVLIGKNKNDSDYDELKEFWNACGKLARERQPGFTAGAVFGPMFQLLLLTGARRAEVAEMEWRELDLTNRIWTIPGARTKNSEEHRIYLSDPALAIIKAIKRIEDCEFVFTTNGTSPSSGFSKAKTALDKITPGIAPYVIHDLRRTCATGMARLGIAVSVTEKALNHISGTLSGIVGTYQQHDYADETKEAFIAWGNFIARLVSGDAANVIELRPEKAPALAG